MKTVIPLNTNLLVNDFVYTQSATCFSFVYKPLSVRPT